MFDDKKDLETRTLWFVVTKNSNWEIFSKSLVNFKREDGVKDEKL